MRTLISICLWFFLSGSGLFAADELGYKLLRVLDHDINDSTQGLELNNDLLAESTGGFGRSRLRLKALDSGQVVAEYALPDHQFGEGLTRVGDQWIQLTWRSGIARVFDEHLRELRQWRYQGEGWGLCFDGAHFLMSDGSALLQKRDPKSFELLEKVNVTFRGKPLTKLNELECVDGWVLANVWLSDVVVVIDPVTGTVFGYWDFSGLRMRFRKPASWNQREDVLNGIAYKPDTGTYLLTGKRWPALFEVSLSIPAADKAALLPHR